MRVSKGKDFGKIDYKFNTVTEIEPNIYLIISQKNNNQKLKGGPLFKQFIVDASKKELSASIRQLTLPFDNDPKIV